MIVYLTTNLINGMRYIGRDAKNNNDYLGSGSILRKAIKKYGKHNFKKEILQECNSLEELKIAEKYWIDYYDASNSKEFYNILNSSTGGDSLSNHPELETIKKKIKTARVSQIIIHSEETKKKIGDSQRGEKAYWYGKTKPDSIKEKVSKSLKGRPKPLRSKEHSENLSKANKGKEPWNKGKTNIYSEETRKKMSESHKGKEPWNKGLKK